MPPDSHPSALPVAVDAEADPHNDSANSTDLVGSDALAVVSQEEMQTDEAALIELANLSSIEYERCRKQRALQLGCRVKILDKLVEKEQAKLTVAKLVAAAEIAKIAEIADEEVDGHKLLSEIVDYVNEHVVMPKGAAEVCGLFVLHTYAIDATDISPILEITSPLMRCGKTRLAGLLSKMCKKATMASSISPAALFRAIDALSPTLIIDEGDTFLNLSEELRGLLNSGHTRDGATVMRCEGGGLVTFSTWGPKIIALIGRPPATIQDRAITIHMQRKPAGRFVKPIPSSANLIGLRKRCARWAQDHLNELRNSPANLPAGLNDREADNWSPLFSIAENIGGDWKEHLDKAVMEIAGEDEEDSHGVMLLVDIRTVFDDEQTDSIRSEVLINRLAQMDGRPWPEYRHGRPLTSNHLARILKLFRITPGQIWAGERNRRGYRRGQFENVWRLYTPEQTARVLDAKETGGSRLGQGDRNVEVSSG